VNASRVWIVPASTVALFATAAILVGTRSDGDEKTRAATKPTASACAQTLLADWSDGRIDRTYPIACYRAALRSLPTDLRVYSSAPDDIGQALSQRILESAGRKTKARTLTR
jgi:hypothetical protein